MTTLVSGGAVPVGSVLPFAGNSSNVPDGFLLCNGALLNRNDYSDLFAAIGTHWGFNTGVDFRIPTTQGLFLRGVAYGSGFDPDRNSRSAVQTNGQTGDQVGSYQSNRFSSHNHGGGNHVHGTGTQAREQPNSGGTRVVGVGFTFNQTYGSINIGSSGTIISTQGGNQNCPNNVGFNFIIKY